MEATEKDGLVGKADKRNSTEERGEIECRAGNGNNCLIYKLYCFFKLAKTCHVKPPGNS